MAFPPSAQVGAPKVLDKMPQQLLFACAHSFLSLLRAVDDWVGSVMSFIFC